MNGVYEVLNPWAEADPIPLTGISSRLPNLNGKTIGLFVNDKVAAAPMQDAVEQQLKERFDDISISRFVRLDNVSTAETEDKAKYEKWVKEVDAIIFAFGD